MFFSWPIALVLIASSFCAAFGAVFALALQQRWRRHRTFLRPGALPDEAVFLFDGDLLADASDSARDYLAASNLQATDWTRFCALSEPMFPRLEQQIADLATLRRMVVLSPQDPSHVLVAEWRSGLTRIALTRQDGRSNDLAIDRYSYHALDLELSSLRGAMDNAPMMVWRQAADGAIIWANRAYLQIAAKRDGEDAQTWPLPVLFHASELAAVGANKGRAKLAIDGEKKPRWFDLFQFAETNCTLHFAIATDATVQAEQALREFVQTLTKTFAHLPTGLAVFDRQRQLALFNPALIDLTGLGADFLSARPTLFSVLDRLREERRMPEPKNYKAWRQHMVALERAASSGQYEEIWSLPNGQTFRVIGQPHPDGGMALLIEDITTETALTRRFRADLELAQAVLDGIQEAVAVFSPAGTLVQSNAAYARLWGVDPSTTLAQITIGDAMVSWAAGTQTSPIWTRVREFVCTIGSRTAWQEETALLDGRRLICRLQPVQGGSTLVGFTAMQPERPVLAGRRAALPRRTRTLVTMKLLGDRAVDHETV